MGFRERVRGRLSVTEKIILQAYLGHKLKECAGDLPLSIEQYGNNPHPTFVVATTPELAEGNIDLRLRVETFMRQMETIFPDQVMQAEELDLCADNPYATTHTPKSFTVGALNFTARADHALECAHLADRANFVKVIQALESAHRGKS